MTRSGDNSGTLAKSYIDRIVPFLEKIAECREDVREVLKEAHLRAGLDMKALLKVAQEVAMPEEKREKQLAFEFHLHDIRRAAGLPTEITPAAHEEAA